MTKRKFVLRLHIHDVFVATMTMSREQKGIYLDFLLMYANGIEIPASPKLAMEHARGTSEADVRAVLELFGTRPHEELDAQERYGDRIYDEREEPLHISNRPWRY